MTAARLSQVSALRARTDGRYQVTSDQYSTYVGAMREHFGRNVDFGQLHKIYGRLNADSWYSGGEVIGAVPHVKIGRPDFSRISTSQSKERISVFGCTFADLQD